MGIESGAPANYQKAIEFLRYLRSRAPVGRHKLWVEVGARITTAGIAILASIAVPVSSGLAAATLPPPSFGRTLDIGLVSGTVIVTPPGGRSFALGVVDRNIPIRSLIDTTHGRVDLRAADAPVATAASLRIEDAQFSGGAFRVGQPRSAPFTVIRLAGGSFASCSAQGAAGTAAALPRRIIRLLHASGSGRFQTNGRYAAATVRGTTWLTEDFCNGTLVKVTRGAVVVENLVSHRAITVPAGNSYFAHAPGA
jgi:hypothetical protein